MSGGETWCKVRRTSASRIHEKREDEGISGLFLFTVWETDGYYRFVSAVKEMSPHCVWGMLVDIIGLDEFILN